MTSQPRLSLSKENTKEKELESIAVGYINRIIKNDIELGRGDKNFFKDDLNEIRKNIDVFRQKGFRVFIGGGNIFILKIEQKLTGWRADCMHLRGLAQRKIQIKEMV